MLAADFVPFVVVAVAAVVVEMVAPKLRNLTVPG
jgi:hypothetical protein